MTSSSYYPTWRRVTFQPNKQLIGCPPNAILYADGGTQLRSQCHKDFKQDAMLVLCYGLICDKAVHIKSSQSGPVTLFEMKKKSFTYSFTILRV